MSDTFAKNTINPNLTFSVQRIGNEQTPIIIVDNFFSSPETLMELAASEPSFTGQKTDYYPGVRKPISGDYAEQSLNVIEPIIREIFAVPSANTSQVSLGAFSLATTPADKLRPIQCVPHIDTHHPYQFAVVHYLCSEHYGGTSFYRHKVTGYETITDARLEKYFQTLKQEVMSGGLPKLEYINGDTPLFIRIANVEVKFNRAVIYLSNALHAGNINETLGLSANPKDGRLTANIFINFSGQ